PHLPPFPTRRSSDLAAPRRPAPTGSPSRTVSIAQLDEWLAHGANLNVELNNAVLAGDQVRIAYLLDSKHVPIDALDLQGETALRSEEHTSELQSPYD